MNSGSITVPPHFSSTTNPSVLCLRIEGFVVELKCGGTVIEPEFRAPPLTSRAWRSIGAPEDGRVLSETPYDWLKEILLEQSS